MQRVILGQPTSVTQAFYTGTEPDTAVTTATVDIWRDDGTQLVTGASATALGNSNFKYDLSSGQTSLLDKLKVRFTANTGTQLVQFVEIVGGVFFDLQQLRYHPDVLQSNVNPTDAELDRARTWAEQRWEGVCGYAFVPRYGRKRFPTRPPRRLAAYLRAVRSVTVNDQIVPPPYTFTEEGFLRIGYGQSNPRFWDSVPPNRGIAVVTFEHGLDAPDYPVSEAVLTLAKVHLLRGPITDRATQVPTGDGGTINLATPGLANSWFGIPEVDAIAEENRLLAIA